MVNTQNNQFLMKRFTYFRFNKLPLLMMLAAPLALSSGQVAAAYPEKPI